jgi:hypothetical protein
MCDYFQRIRKLFKSLTEDNIDEEHGSLQSEKRYELDGASIEWNGEGQKHQLSQDPAP